MKTKKGQELFQIRGTPYRCHTCGEIQINTQPKTGPLVNCNNIECQGDEVSACGPEQALTIIVFSERLREPLKPTINQHPEYERAKNVCPNCHGTSTSHYRGSREYEVELKCNDCGEIFDLSRAATVEIGRKATK